MKQAPVVTFQILVVDREKGPKRKDEASPDFQNQKLRGIPRLIVPRIVGKFQVNIQYSPLQIFTVIMIHGENC